MATCMGAGKLSLIGIRKQDLLIPEMNLSAANLTGINIMGATFLKLKGCKGANERTTRQMVYVVEEMDHLLLSMEACKDFGIIGENFPTVGSHGAKELQGDHLQMCQKFLFVSQAINILMTSEGWQNFRSIQTF